MKVFINRETLLKPLSDGHTSDRLLRSLVDYRPVSFKNKICTISNEFSVDLGGSVTSATTSPVEGAGDGDDGDSGDGDPESDRQKLKSQKLSYIYQPPPNYQLPKEGFVRLRHILQVLPIGKSTWWAGVKSGRYPKPVRTLGQRITAWRVEDIHELIKNAA